MGSIDSDMYACKICSTIYRSPPGDPLGCSPEHALQVADMQRRVRRSEHIKALRNGELQTTPQPDRPITPEQADELFRSLIAD